MIFVCLVSLDKGNLLARLEWLIPVKLRPKINSSGGNNALGAVVLVMVSFEGSISVIDFPTEASAWMLYGSWLRHRSDAATGAVNARDEQWDSEASMREDGCRNIVEIETNSWLLGAIQRQKKEGWC